MKERIRYLAEQAQAAEHVLEELAKSVAPAEHSAKLAGELVAQAATEFRSLTKRLARRTTQASEIEAYEHIRVAVYASLSMLADQGEPEGALKRQKPRKGRRRETPQTAE